jgi:tRNA-specific 2-thiouridylase
MFFDRNNKINKNKKVFVGLSGGVDSSVSAALLKKQGFDVTGVFIKVWQPRLNEAEQNKTELSYIGAKTGVFKESCEWKEDRLDAMRVAAWLDIPFITMDLEKEYKEEVVDYMVREYKNGRIPNPDVLCNKSVKFNAFLKKAIEMGADFVATGHYAQRSRKFSIFNFQTLNFKKQRKYKLLKSVDKDKDQSYFLWTLTQKQLNKILFPIGGYEKTQVRKIARKFGLPNADRKDSQGLCFVGKLNMKEFLKEFIPEKKGDVINEKGEVIGQHDGAAFYTIGQRHGFIVSKKRVDDTPYFIIAKDVKTNIITVSRKNPKGMLPGEKNKITLKEINWISGEKPQNNKIYTARVRYRQTLQKCTLEFMDSSEVIVIFDNPQIASPGQSLVLYDGEECLGGGVIQ